MPTANEQDTALFGHEWHILDNEMRQIVKLFII
jgi:hypothetical protein